jgi:hypothetical protein
MQEHRCEICGGSFQSHLALHGHQQVYHGQKQREVGEQRLSFIAPITFRCGFCDRAFDRHDALLTHIERRHKAERERRAQELAARDALLPAGKRRRGRRAQNAA